MAARTDEGRPLEARAARRPLVRAHPPAGERDDRRRARVRAAARGAQVRGERPPLAPHEHARRLAPPRGRRRRRHLLRRRQGRRDEGAARAGDGARDGRLRQRPDEHVAVREAPPRPAPLRDDQRRVGDGRRDEDGDGDRRRHRRHGPCPGAPHRLRRRRRRRRVDQGALRRDDARRRRRAPAARRPPLRQRARAARRGGGGRARERRRRVLHRAQRGGGGGGGQAHRALRAQGAVEQGRGGADGLAWMAT